MSKKIKTKKNTNKTRNVIDMNRDSVPFNELSYYVDNMIYADTTIRTICDYMDMVGINYDKKISESSNLNSETIVHVVCAFLTYTAADIDDVLKDLSEDDRRIAYDIIEEASDAIDEIASLDENIETYYNELKSSKNLRFSAGAFQSVVTAFRKLDGLIKFSGVNLILPKIYLEMFEVLGMMLYAATDNTYTLKDILIKDSKHDERIKNKIKEKFDIDLDTPIEFTLGDILKQADLIYYNILKDNGECALDKIDRLENKSKLAEVLVALGKHYANIINSALNTAVHAKILDSDKADLLIGECSETGMYELLKTAAPEVLDLKLRKVLWFTDVTEEDSESGLLCSTMIYMDENWVNVDNEFYNKLSAIGDLLKSIALLDDKTVAGIEYCNTFIDLWGFETEEPEMAN